MFSQNIDPFLGIFLEIQANISKILSEPLKMGPMLRDFMWKNNPFGRYVPV